MVAMADYARLVWHLIEGKLWEMVALVLTPAIYLLIACDVRSRTAVRRELITNEARAAVSETGKAP